MQVKQEGFFKQALTDAISLAHPTIFEQYLLSRTDIDPELFSKYTELMRIYSFIYISQLENTDGLNIEEHMAELKKLFADLSIGDSTTSTSHAIDEFFTQIKKAQEKLSKKKAKYV